MLIVGVFHCVLQCLITFNNRLKVQWVCLGFLSIMANDPVPVVSMAWVWPAPHLAACIYNGFVGVFRGINGFVEAIIFKDDLLIFKPIALFNQRLSHRIAAMNSANQQVKYGLRC